MKVTKNNYEVRGQDAEVIYDDEIEGGGLRIELPGSNGDWIEINDASDDYGKPRLEIRSGGRHSYALLVRPVVANSLLVFTEDLQA